MTELTIRQSDPGLPEAMALIHELDAYLETLYPSESNYLLNIQALQQHNVAFFLAERGRQTVGCGALRFEDGYAEVKRMYVRPAARGLGFGAQMMTALETCARERGVFVLRLETGVSQPEAIGLYEKFGFVRCGAFGTYPDDDPLSVFYEKRLPL